MIYLVRPTEERKEQAIEFRQEFFDHGEFVINGSELFDKTEDYIEWCRSIDANTKEETVNPKGLCHGNAAAIIRGCQKGGDGRTVSFCGKEE